MGDVNAEPLRDLSDAALVDRRSARYRQDALAEAYRRHAGAVFGLARRLIAQEPLAEEIAQEVFLRLWNHPDRFDPSRGSLRSLPARAEARSGRRHAALRGRKASPRGTGGSGDRRGRLRPGARGLVDLATAERVRAAVSSLPDGEREAIELAYFGGHTYREVAALLSEPEGTVKSRIRSGLKRMRSTLVDIGTGGPS